MRSELTGFRLRAQRASKETASSSRLFACEGSPLKCPIFIVGINSARSLEKPFWDYWDDSYGFNKKDFLNDIGQLRGGLTPTRKKIEIIADSIGQKRILDTNIYSSPTPNTEHLRDEHKATNVFEFLLHEIRPQLVLAHGKEHTVNFFRIRCGASFVEDTKIPQRVSFIGLEFQLLCSHHLWLPSVDPAKIIKILKKAL